MNVMYLFTRLVSYIYDDFFLLLYLIWVIYVNKVIVNIMLKAMLVMKIVV